MYCKYCGQHNASDQTYCQNCGKLIKINTISLDKRNITEKKTSYCKKCGTAVLDRYCTECGTVAYALELKQETKFKAPDLNINIGKIDDLKSKFQDSPLGDIKSVGDVKSIITSKPIFKTSFIGALKILGIGLLISLLLFTVITKIEPVEEILYNIDRAASFGYPEISKVKPNFVDVFNLSLQSPTNLSLNFEGEDYGEKIAIGAKMIMSFKFLILLIIPAIAVIIGQRKLFKDEKSSSENLLEYGFTSLIFSIIVKVIALINQRNIKISDPYDQFKFKLGIGFHDLWSLLTIFTIIFVFHIIISMIIKKDNPFTIFNIKQYPNLGNRINTYIKSMGIYAGIISIAIILMLIYIGVKNGTKALPSTIIGIVLAPAVFVHTWFLSFGYNMTTMATGQRPASFSIWKAWKGVGELKKYSYGSESGAIWGYLFILAILIGLIYVVYRVVKDIETEGYFLKLGFIAGSISVINVVFSYLGSIGLTASTKVTGDTYYTIADILYELDLGFLGPIANAGALKQSYSFMSIIVATFIWIFAVGAIIYFVREKEVYNKIVSFLDTHKQKIIIGYSALIVVSFYLVQSKLLENMAQVILNVFPMMDMFL